MIRRNYLHGKQFFQQDSGFFPEAVLNLLTNMGSGFAVRHTDGMNLEQLIRYVCIYITVLHFDRSLFAKSSSHDIYLTLRSIKLCAVLPNSVWPWQTQHQLNAGRLWQASRVQPDASQEVSDRFRCSEEDGADRRSEATHCEALRKNGVSVVFLHLHIFLMVYSIKSAANLSSAVCSGSILTKIRVPFITFLCRNRSKDRSLMLLNNLSNSYIERVLHWGKVMTFS